MKKNQLAVLYIMIICFATIASLSIPRIDHAEASEEAVVIPKEAIRLRILANSDGEEDQKVKRVIRDEVNANITEWVKELTSIDAARQVIKGHLPEIQRIAESYVKKHHLNQDVNVTFGQANFPTKLYGKYLYPAGEYEAIVITLGKGQGANWWCVLFPPLCFLDFSNGTAVSMSPTEEADKEQVANEAEIKADQKQVVNEAEIKADQKQVVNEAKIKDEQEQVVSEAKIKGKVEHFVKNEEPEVIEKKVFVVELFEDLFGE
ncbi:stage II sporulation protein R [Bacillus massiliigorillae]|uniref:stage II sporulation protein R n=1 Tax=Bacillus massiliigorillae TaxID=1243664 RepID=UPI00039DED93|nr:stage II sporulation protein R [Bacillus massiliigorillae]